MTDYRPIACSLHDRLEHFAIRRTIVRVRFVDSGGTDRSEDGRIEDLFARGGAEYLRLDSGTEIRLDRLRDVQAH